MFGMCLDGSNFDYGWDYDWDYYDNDDNNVDDNNENPKNDCLQSFVSQASIKDNSM